MGVFWWAAPGAALLSSFVPTQSAPAGSAVPAVALLLHTDQRRIAGVYDEEDFL